MNTSEATQTLLDDLNEPSESCSSDSSVSDAPPELNSDATEDDYDENEMSATNAECYTCNSSINICYFLCTIFFSLLYQKDSKCKSIKWETVSTGFRRTRAINITRHKSGVTEYAQFRVHRPIDSFGLIIDDTMLENIVNFTNLKLEIREIRLIDLAELKCFLGLVILAGTMNSNHENIDWMWKEGFVCEIFRQFLL